MRGDEAAVTGDGRLGPSHLDVHRDGEPSLDSPTGREGLLAENLNTPDSLTGGLNPSVPTYVLRSSSLLRFCFCVSVVDRHLDSS